MSIKLKVFLETMASITPFSMATVRGGACRRIAWQSNWPISQEPSQSQFPELSSI